MNVNIIIWKEQNVFVAWDMQTNLSSFGDTEKEARESLEEVIELHFS